MNIIIKHFRELSTKELWEIYQLRTSVFVVEQKCPYQEVDEADTVSYHVYIRDEDGISAYARVIPPGINFDDTSIGRVLAIKRRQGLATAIVKACIATAEEKFGAKSITIEAQTYTRKLYENLGFIRTSEEFLEDGIPHIIMRRA